MGTYGRTTSKNMAVTSAIRHQHTIGQGKKNGKKCKEKVASQSKWRSSEKRVSRYGMTMKASVTIYKMSYILIREVND